MWYEWRKWYSKNEKIKFEISLIQREAIWTTGWLTIWLDIKFDLEMVTMSSSHDVCVSVASFRLHLILNGAKIRCSDVLLTQLIAWKEERRVSRKLSSWANSLPFSIGTHTHYWLCSVFHLFKNRNVIDMANVLFFIFALNAFPHCGYLLFHYNILWASQ